MKNQIKTIKIMTGMTIICAALFTTTTISSCKKDNPAILTANPTYIMAMSTYGLDRLRNCGFFNNTCCTTSSKAIYDASIMEIDQSKGTASVTMKGNDSVKITYSFDKTNISQRALDTLFGKGFYISKDSGTIYNPNPDILKVLFTNNNITGFATETNIPLGEYPVINNTGSKLNPTNHIQIHNIYLHKNGGGRVEFVFNKK